MLSSDTATAAKGDGGREHAKPHVRRYTQPLYIGNHSDSV